MTLNRLQHFPIKFDAFDHSRTNTDPKLFQKRTKFESVYQFDRRRTVPCSLAKRVRREATRGDDETLVRTSYHRASKVSNGTSTDSSFVLLTLEKNLKADQIDP